VATSKKAAKKASTAKKSGETTRTRTARPYPASSIADALELGKAIMTFSAGEKVRSLTLLEK
jgi:bisphosphoglycerate-dependent phosphoglycerate mutase